MRRVCGGISIDRNALLRHLSASVNEYQLLRIVADTFVSNQKYNNSSNDKSLYIWDP